MEKAVAIFAIINFSVMGVSHVVHPEVWIEFFRKLHSQGRAGAFANGFLSLFMGSIIVAFHNVWTGLPIVLTVIGWAFLMKSCYIFINPNWGVRSIEKGQSTLPILFRVAGCGFIGIALITFVSIYTGSYEAVF